MNKNKVHSRNLLCKTRNKYEDMEKKINKNEKNKICIVLEICPRGNNIVLLYFNVQNQEFIFYAIMMSLEATSVFPQRARDDAAHRR